LLIAPLAGPRWRSSVHNEEVAETAPNILLVDDDVELTALMAEFFAASGYALKAVYNGPQGLSEALARRYDLVLLDVMMPGFDGFELLRRLRERSDVPVLMLTAKSESGSRIQGLEAGADDYLPKPFEPLELLARARAILRRTLRSSEASSQPIEVGNIRLDPGGRSVRCGGEPVEVTTVEFDVLEILMRAAGRVVSRDQVSQQLYGRDASPFDRSLDVHVSHLRKKLDRATGRIRSVRGVGYQFAIEG
jgi:two-component system response regulator CpxR